MKQIKKQGFYFSNGELDPNIAGLSIPIKFSSKEPPLALTLLASKNRFEFVNLQKLIEIRQIPCLLISHDLSDIIRLSQKIGIMEKRTQYSSLFLVYVMVSIKHSSSFFMARSSFFNSSESDFGPLNILGDLPMISFDK